MPKIPRHVVKDESLDTLNDELKQWSAEVQQDGVYLPTGDPNVRGNKVVPNRAYKPAAVLYEQKLVAPETEIFVVKTIDEAGIAWGAFFDPQGNKRHQFFTGDAFAVEQDTKRAKK
jgi:hypothetical protein